MLMKNSLFRINSSYEALYSRADNSIWPEDVMDIQMDIYEETSSRLHFKVPILYSPGDLLKHVLYLQLPAGLKIIT